MLKHTYSEQWNKLDNFDFLVDLFARPFEKFRVFLNHSYYFTPQDYTSEFVGKTGTLTRCEFGGSYAATVELDRPHSQFGNFASLCYPEGYRENEVTYIRTDGNLQRLCAQCLELDNMFYYPFYTETAEDRTFEEMSKVWESAQDLWKKWYEKRLDN